MAPMNEVTRILSGIEAGDPHAAEQLLPLVYDELRKLAAQKLAQEKLGQTLQATALVHEPSLGVVGAAQPGDSPNLFLPPAAGPSPPFPSPKKAPHPKHRAPGRGRAPGRLHPPYLISARVLALPVCCCILLS